jgi:hypothetical protein
MGNGGSEEMEIAFPKTLPADIFENRERPNQIVGGCPL